MRLRPWSILAFIIPAVVLLGHSALLWAGGAREESASDRGVYVAEQGRIIMPEEIDIGSYIASVDYGYPNPLGDFGVTLYSGHRQVSMAGQEEIIQIGIQGKRMRFEDLPVLNLAFVFDSSGSMSEKDKIEWAKDAFDLFLRRLRRQDILSVVTFSDGAKLLLPSTRIGDITDRKDIARLKLSYDDRAGARHAMGPYSLTVDYTDSSIAAGGISDPIVLKAGTMLHTAQGLEAIGFLYYSSQTEAVRLNRINRSSWHNVDVLQEGRVEAVVTSEKTESSGVIRANKQRCLNLSEAIKKEISNTHLRLGEESFSMDLIIMRKYIEILGHELFLSEPVISRLLADEEILSQEIAGGVRKQLEGLVEELTLGLEARAGGSIVFFGFTSGDGEATSLQHTADRIAHSRLARFPNFLIIGEQTVDEALAQLEISRRSLLDNTIALKVGALLSADFLLIGRIVEMPNSVVVFGKLLNCGSGAVESVAQIILPRDD